MKVAQELYEGVNLGRTQRRTGLITYMRTDSLRISEEAQAAAARADIQEKFGADYCPKTPSVYKIQGRTRRTRTRPSAPPTRSILPDAVKGKLSDDQYQAL